LAGCSKYLQAVKLAIEGKTENEEQSLRNDFKRFKPITFGKVDI